MDGQGTNASLIQFTDEELGYDRSLALIDDKVYVISSNKGEVIRIDDFENREFTRYVSYGKLQCTSAGAWQVTGLVLNHVEYFNGYYYGSNFFQSTYAKGTNPDINRLIRWKSWDDFQKGNWEDISYLIPHDLVPYYFTVHNNKLFISTLWGSDTVKNNIYLIEITNK
jgi:hypothetical protein